MRIISQDKKHDVPYNCVTVYLSSAIQTFIQADFVAYRYTEILGAYNSEEDALYVMDCIRYSMKYGYDYFYMPSADYVPIMRQKAAEGGEL